MEVDPTQSAPQWVRAPTPEVTDDLIAGGISARLAPLLARRGVESAASAEDFLAPSMAGMHDPTTIPGLPAAVDRLREAVGHSEKVAIVGDYDVDGVTATALLVAVLQSSGLDVVPILPERLAEGYGFQPVHVETAQNLGCTLIVTADCGSTAVEAAERAVEAGVDVIVTDHHLGAEANLPESVIEINPHRPESDYPFPDLSGVGVAYKLAVGFLNAQQRKVDDEALLRITSLGTICDLVPLVGENRIIAAKGLAAMDQTRSIGLRRLMKNASVKSPVTAMDVGFRLGPRINAAGRLGSPMPALNLLLTRDRSEAGRLADDLETWNRERQGTERGVVEEAENLFAGLSPMPAILVGWSEGWHPGVLGIAAGRIARKFYRPTILMQVDGDSAKGSGRSVSGIHLFEFLSRWRDEYLRFGGHAQAIGLSVDAARLEEMRDRWQSEAARCWEVSQLTKSYEYELTLTAGEIDDALVSEISRLEPFGMANRQPVLRVGNLQLAGTPRRFGRGHLGARARGHDGGEIELLGWGWQDREEDLQGEFEILGTLERDRYHRGPVLRLLDARPSQPPREPV